LKSIAQALQQGVEGVVKEFELLSSPWGLELSKVKVPTRIWHGTGDTYVPFAMGRILHEQIENSTFREVPDGGHFMVIPLIREILSDIVSNTWSNRDIGAA
jgi:pimeloyl-ACP methyl ester carboxylesterase